ncbi:MAG: 5-formyltetrahydrofolate cyclo-ligase [Acidimicrobiales bacterium]|nr:MAG: 5-formyltetrahydrofolate cyclo-ligase [Actinomycetota bacterium]MBV6509681.1 5-formyltetrahydrofolate cyclo-ligase [Acidimicrobiales bacterium]RIK06370.1 MAG: 5-formyltetrahydrofolate cyclo-ligase [Acidobacteriota bacterium]
MVDTGENAGAGGLRALRATMREQRRRLDPQRAGRAARAVLTAITRLPEYRTAETVASYMATGGELDLSGLIEAVRTSGRVALLPVVGPGRAMAFAPVAPDTELSNNRYGIAEPVVDRSQHVAPMELDLVVVPTVAFDGECHRVGSGGGYYDRAFAPLARQRPSGPVLCGVAFALQRVERIVPQPWDVALDLVVTENEVIRRVGRPARRPAHEHGPGTSPGP